MNFLITPAWAQGDAGAGSGLIGILPMILIFVVFYFLLIRPQQKRAKEHRNMVANLAKGDEVVTNGGTLGKILGKFWREFWRNPEGKPGARPGEKPGTKPETKTRDKTQDLKSQK